jgi:hypothetical protein
MAALKLKITSWGEIALDKKELRALMRSAGNDVKKKTAQLISRTAGGGRSYSYGTASAPGEPPIARTGALKGSLRVYTYKEGAGFAVRERQFYSLFLEAGAHGGGNPGKRATARQRADGRRHRARGVYNVRVLEPRPHLDRVIEQEQAKLDERVRKAFTEGLTWKQTK